MVKKRPKKKRVTLRSLKRDLKEARARIDDLTARLTLANKERVDFFHKIGQVEETAIEMRGKSQRIADITRTLLGRQDQPAPPMTAMMMVTRR
jgi:chorismate mutase